MRILEMVKAERTAPTERRIWSACLVDCEAGVTMRVKCSVQRRPSGRGRWPAKWESEPVREVPPFVRVELRLGLMRQLNQALDDALGAEP